MYFLLSSSSQPRRRIATKPFIEKVSWWRGAVISAGIEEPLQFTLDPYSPFSSAESPHFGAIMETNPPLWRDDFIQALKDCGVYNFDTYSVSIFNPSNESTLNEFYKELNADGIENPAEYLRLMGVSDIDEWVDKKANSYITNYKAVNILGLVSAADMQKSIATVHDGIPLIDVDFDELVIDEQKTKGIKLFRLAESTNAILIHESLRDALIEKGFGEDLAFYDLKEAAI